MGFAPMWPDLWDAAGVAYTTGDIMTTEVLPRFTLNRPATHFRTLMLSDPLHIAPAGSGFTVQVEMAVETRGTEANPFALDLGDPRLAAGALVIVDYETGMIFDFFVSNSKVCALYERSARARSRLGAYPAYTILQPTEVRTLPGQWHGYEVSYDRRRGIVSYSCDGGKVWEVAHVGAPIGQRSPQVTLNSIRVGGGIFVLLDDLNNDLEEPGDNPKIAGFLARDQPDVFGQGTKVSFRRFGVELARAR